MCPDLLIHHVRPMGGPTVDVLIQDGVIHRLEPEIHAPDATVIEGEDQLLLPGLVNAHAHLDKNLLGLPWHVNQVPLAPTIGDLTANERRLRRELNLETRVQSAREVQAAVEAGVTHIRTHVDIDTEAKLGHLEGVMGTCAQFKDAVSMQMVAFPQSGMLIRPGTVALLEEALRMGAEVLGGLDPSIVDRDPVRHLDTIFGLADRFGVELDIHLHEPGTVGAYAVELIAERTRALGMQGRVTISHVFCLGMVDERYLGRLIDLLLDNRITIMSLGSGAGPFPPILRLVEAGVAMCTGTDGVRDTWGPYNTVDMLERVRLLGWRLGVRREAEMEMLLDLVTFGGATRMGDASYGLAVGSRADLVILPGATPTQAIIDHPPRSFVIKGGRVVVTQGKYHR